VKKHYDLREACFIAFKVYYIVFPAFGFGFFKSQLDYLYLDSFHIILKINTTYLTVAFAIDQA
jgi:hypothetical protein